MEPIFRFDQIFRFGRTKPFLDARNGRYTMRNVVVLDRKVYPMRWRVAQLQKLTENELFTCNKTRGAPARAGYYKGNPFTRCDYFFLIIFGYHNHFMESALKWAPKSYWCGLQRVKGILSGGAAFLPREWGYPPADSTWSDNISTSTQPILFPDPRNES